MSYPVRCRICHEQIGFYKEPLMVTCPTCYQVEYTAEVGLLRETWNKAHKAADEQKAKAEKLTETAAAFCDNCKKPTMHRYNEPDLCCNECHSITACFHEPVTISRNADKQPEPEPEPEPVVVRDFLVETLLAIPAEITYENGYQKTAWGKACHDAAARIKSLELDIEALEHENRHYKENMKSKKERSPCA